MLRCFVNWDRLSNCVLPSLHSLWNICISLGTGAVLSHWNTLSWDTAVDVHKVGERQHWPECHFKCHSSLPSQSRLSSFFESTATAQALLLKGGKGRIAQELTAELHPLVEWTHYEKEPWLCKSRVSKLVTLQTLDNTSIPTLTRSPNVTPPQKKCKRSTQTFVCCTSMWKSTWDADSKLVKMSMHLKVAFGVCFKV